MHQMAPTSPQRSPVPSERRWADRSFDERNYILTETATDSETARLALLD
jgi:hypothetical protein